MSFDPERTCCWNCAHSSANYNFFGDGSDRRIKEGQVLTCYRFHNLVYTHTVCGDFVHRLDYPGETPFPPHIWPQDDVWLASIPQAPDHGRMISQNNNDPR